MDITNNSNLRKVSKVLLNPSDKGERQVALNSDSLGRSLSQMFALRSFHLCESALICVLTSDALPITYHAYVLICRPAGAFVYGGSGIL